MPSDAFTNRATLAVLGIKEPVIGDRAEDLFVGLEALAKAAGLPFLDVGDLFGDEPFEIGSVLSGGIARLKKRSLILGGGALEGAITQTAIQTLLDGYDVFVPADLCVGMDEELRPIHFDRLRDVGGTVTSHRQIVLELLAQTSDQGLRAPLETHLAGL